MRDKVAVDQLEAFGRERVEIANQDSGTDEERVASDPAQLTRETPRLLRQARSFNDENFVTSLAR